MKRLPTSCAAEITLQVIGGRWKVAIVWALLQGTKRFSDLCRSMPGITQKMLTQQLRELELNRIVVRKVYPQVPPKVEYSITPLGRSLKPVVNAIHRWGLTHVGNCP